MGARAATMVTCECVPVTSKPMHLPLGKDMQDLMATPRMDVGGTDPHNMLHGLWEMFDHIYQLRVPYRMVEIGCFHGVSTEFFCRNVPFVVAIDPWDGKEDTYQGFLKRCGKYLHEPDEPPRQGHIEPYGRLKVVRDVSPRALDIYPADTFDFAYIDGDHSFDAVVADILACSRVVCKAKSLNSPGADDLRGFICGHDFPMPQVAKAVRLLLGEPETFSDGSWLCPNRLIASAS